MNATELRGQLASAAAARYRAAGRWAYHFARIKLGNDPFYSLLLAEGLVPAGARILDLGCAQGLLAAWLVAAQESFSTGVWDSAFPAPGALASYRGIDRNQSEIRRARQALGGTAEFVAGDVTLEDLSGATFIVLLDVLHYLDYASQRNLLCGIRAALPAGGRLLLRVGDSDGSLRAWLSGWVDRNVARLRGGEGVLSRRPLKEWLALLEEVGFSVQEVARQRSPGYVNCLLLASPAPGSGSSAGTLPC
jgi:SAM-dependent methyltransferase